MTGIELAELLTTLKDQAYFHATVQKTYWTGLAGIALSVTVVIGCLVAAWRDHKTQWADGLVVIFGPMIAFLFLVLGALALGDVIWPEPAAIHYLFGR